MQQKVNFNIIIDGLVAINGCSCNMAESFLKELFLLVPEMIQQNKTISIKGIGSFMKSSKDNESIIYEPDKSLLEALNQPFSCFEPVELDELINEDILNEEFLYEKENDVKNLYGDTIGEESKEDINNPIFENDVLVCEEQNEIIETKEICDENISEPTKDLENTTDPNYNQLSINESIELKSRERKPIIYIGVFFIGIMIGFLMGYVVKDIIMSNNLDRYLQHQKFNNVDTRLMQSVDTIDTIAERFIKQPDSIYVQLDNDKSKADSIVIDKITKNRFLTTMAREHYGNLNFWVYIYEENMSNLGHPDKITPGTTVVIPSKSKYNIDPFNEEAINIAKAKSKEIYAKFRKKD